MVNEFVNKMIDYLDRGRRLQHHTDEESQRMWAASFKFWTSGNAAPRHKLLPDVMAEMAMRLQEPDLELVKPKVLRLVAVLVRHKDAPRLKA